MHIYYFLHFVWKTIWRKRSRVVLTVFSISISLMSLLFFFGLRRGYTHTMSGAIQNFGAHLIAMPKGCPYEASSVILQGGILPKQLPQDTLGQIQNISNIQHSYAMLTGMLPSLHTKGDLDRIVGVTSGITNTKKAWNEIPSTDLEHFFSSEKYVIVGFKKAESMKVNRGDSLILGSTDQSFTVLAVLSSMENQDDLTLFVPLSVAQKWFRQQGYISSVSVTLRDLSLVESTITEIESIEDVQVITMDELLQMVLEYIQMLQWLIVGILLIAIFTSFIQIVNTMTISVTDQMKEIVVLKAFGATNYQMGVWVLLQSITIGIVGISLGVVLSYICVPLYEYSVQSFIPMIQEGPIFLFSLYDIFMAAFITLLVTVVACFYPMYLTMKESPAKAFAGKSL
ncbi:MAG: FtsX-like permease family protein [Caldisericia bacterium]|nr:FtsX-like permease family protein [Caldisericia bacterium]MDD4614093.1 FtsX-like permease family protein [Caldisericia bacterium]